MNRTKDFLDDIREKYKGKNVLIVTHNFISKCIWINETHEADKEKINSFYHENGEIKNYIENE